MTTTRRSLIPSGHKAPVEVMINNWEGGLNEIRAGLGLRPDELAAVRDYKYVETEQGLGLMSREGLKKQTSTGCGAAIKDLAAYITTAGITEVLAVAGSDLFKNVAGVMTKVADLAGSRGRMVQFNNVMAIADGSYLKYYDGSSLVMAWDSGEHILSSVADYDQETKLYTGSVTRAGHEFTTPSWDSGFTLPLSGFDDYSVRFWLKKYGTPPGDGAVKVRLVSDDSVVAAVDFTADDLEATGQVEAFNFSSGEMEPETAYYVVVEYDDGASSSSNCVTVCYSTDTDASGNYITFSGSYSPVAGDCYVQLRPGLAPQASMLEVRKSRLHCDDQAAGHRNWMHISNAGDQNQWTGTGCDTIVFEQGAEITAIKNFYSMTMVHLRGGPKVVVKVSGSSIPFAVDDYLKGAAAINQDVVQNVGNDYLFLDDAGLVSLMAWERTGDFEYSIKSDKTKRTVNQSVSASSFGGHCTTEMQYWLDVADRDGVAYVYDAQYGVWTTYLFLLGADVVPSVYSEWGGDAYVGDSAGHYWKQDIKSPQYTDGGAEYSPRVLFAPFDLSTKLQKHWRLVNVEARARLSAVFDLNLFKNLSASSFKTIKVDLPIDPDVTVDELEMTLDEMTFPLDDLRSNLYLSRVNFEAKTLQLGIEDVDLAGSPLIVHAVTVEGAILSRR